MYPEELVAPMRADLTNNGFIELRDKSQVDNTLPSAKGTSFIKPVSKALLTVFISEESMPGEFLHIKK